MDALTLLIVYLVTQNPDFQGNLTPICDKLKQSEDMLKFLGSLSSFPCSPADKPEPQQKPCDPCDRCEPCKSCNAAPPPPHPASNAGGTVDSKARTNNAASAGTAASAGASANSTPNASATDQSPLRTLGGEWLEKYITKYLKN